MHTIAFTTHACTRTLDSAITAARIQYAQERGDFHDYFDNLEVPRIQKILRGQRRAARAGRGLHHVVTTLLMAQFKSPHRLWELLLLQAFEKTLVARRRAISTAENPALDARVAATFLETLRDLPLALEGRALKRYVLDRSFFAFTDRKSRDRGRRAALAHDKAKAQAARAGLARLARHAASKNGKAAAR